jgi:hypothetical protein
MTSAEPTGPSVEGGASQIEVSPEALTAAANKMYSLQDRVAGIRNTLSTNAAGLGEPWGNDSYGKHFANGSEGYLANRDSLIQGPSGALPQLVTEFQSFGDDMTSAAASFERSEETAREHFDPSGN